jgi:HK97 family phage major capsid protein
MATEQLLKELHDLNESIQSIEAKQEKFGEDREKVAQLTAEVSRLSEQIRDVQQRKASFATSDAEPVHRNGGSPQAGLSALLQTRSSAPEVREFHEASDTLYILSNILNKDPRQTEYYRWASAHVPVMKDALAEADVGAAGDGWYPVEFSASMQEQVRLARRVASFHARVTMPTDPFKLPIEGSDASAFLVAEATGATDFITASKLVPDTLGSPGLTNLTLATKKLGARVVVSTEATEASIIPILPYVRDKLVRAMSDAEEDNTINGDENDNIADLSADDTDVGATHPRKAYGGYRDHTKSTTRITAGATTEVEISKLRALRAAFGKYGVQPAGLTWLTGPQGYIKMLGAKDASGNQVLQTIDKYGGQATLVTGELGRVDGAPVVVSEFVREDLNASGVYDGVTTDTTMILLVNRASFIYGDFRGMSLRSRDIIETDQTVLVVLARSTFASWYANKAGTGDPCVGYIYNLKK